MRLFICLVVCFELGWFFFSPKARNAAGLKKELDSITSDIVETIQEIRYLIADEEDDVEDPKR